MSYSSVGTNTRRDLSAQSRGSFVFLAVFLTDILLANGIGTCRIPIASGSSLGNRASGTFVCRC